MELSAERNRLPQLESLLAAMEQQRRELATSHEILLEHSAERSLFCGGGGSTVYSHNQQVTCETTPSRGGPMSTTEGSAGGGDGIDLAMSSTAMSTVSSACNKQSVRHPPSGLPSSNV